MLYIYVVHNWTRTLYVINVNRGAITSVQKKMCNNNYENAHDFELKSTKLQ